MAASSGLSSPAENKFFSVNTSIFAAAAGGGGADVGVAQLLRVVNLLVSRDTRGGSKSGHGLAMQNGLLCATATLLRFVSSAIGWASRNTTHSVASNTENNG